MSKSRRLIEMMLYINVKRKFTSEELANEFRISVRTAYRDLEELSLMGFPIYSEQGRNGGYTLLKNSMMPPVLFTEDEIMAIFFSFQSLKNYRTLPFDAEIDSVSNKLIHNMSGQQKKRINTLKNHLDLWNPTSEVETPMLKMVLGHVLDNHAIEFLYESKSGNKSLFVYPLGIYGSNGFWYMPALTMEQKKVRLYRVDRIKEIISHHSGHNMNFNLTDFREKKLSIKEDTHLKVIFTREGIRQATSEPWLCNHIVQLEDGEGIVDMWFPASEINYITPFFMRLGKDAVVYEPPALIENIIRQSKEMLSLYDN